MSDTAAPRYGILASAQAIRSLVSIAAASGDDRLNDAVIAPAEDAAEMLDELAALVADCDPIDMPTLAEWLAAGRRVHQAVITNNEYEEAVIVNGCNYASDLLHTLARNSALAHTAAPTSADIIRNSTARGVALAATVRASFPQPDSTSNPANVPTDNRDTVVINPANRTDLDAVAGAVATMFAKGGDLETLHFAQACGNAHIASEAIGTITGLDAFNPSEVRQALQRITERQPIANITVGRMNSPVIWIQFLDPAAEPGVERDAAAAETGADVTIHSHGDDISGPILSLTWP